MVETKDKRKMTTEEEMFHKILDSKETIYNRAVSDEYIVHPTTKIEKLTDNMKPSIVSNTTFKTMMNSSKRLKYPAKIFSCFFGISPFKLAKGMQLYKDELDKDKIDDKAERVDFVCKYGNSKWQIEMNNCTSSKTMERNIDYLCKLYIEDNKASTKHRFFPVLQINLNNFSFENDDTTVDIFALRNDKKKLLTEKIIFIVIYIPNLYKKMYTSGIDNLTELERCILAMVEEDIELSKKLSVGDEVMEEFVKEVKDASNNMDFREDYTSEFRAEEHGIEIGEKRGFEIGEKKGFKNGEKHGKEDVVRKCLEKGIDVSLISEISGLSINEVERLKSD